MRPERKIQTHPARATPVSTDDLSDVRDWLQARATEQRLRWLLAHLDDGVVWGRVDDGRLVTSAEAARDHAEAGACCPPLRNATLQQARLFAEHAELLLWRDGDNRWQARLIQDTSDDRQADWNEAIDEPLMLWGTEGKLLPSEFTLLSDGAQGLRHALPVRLALPLDREAVPRLVVRHYLSREADLTPPAPLPSKGRGEGSKAIGFARVVASRLVRLT